MLALPLVLVAVAVLWHRFGVRLQEISVRAAAWAWRHIEESSAYRRLRDRYPAVWRFAQRRLAPRGATGLGLSVLVLAAAAAMWAFLELLVEVVSGSDITQVDHRIINLFQALRTPTGDRLMLGASYAGSGRSVAVIAGAAVLVALVLRRRRDAAMIVASLVAGSAFFAIVKLILGRPRPPFYEARIIQAGFSFPSGHATMASVLYGSLAVLVIAAVHRLWLRVLVAVGAAVAIFWIGLSRVYLGVHYPSDVLAGWVGGALWVLIVLAASRLWRGGDDVTNRSDVARAGASWPRRTAALVLALACVAYLTSTWPAVPAPNQARAPAPVSIAAGQLLPVMQRLVPRHTEGLFGHRQEPLNLMFVADSTTLVGAFRAAGWVQAERLSWSSLWRAVTATLLGRPDAAGPVTPSFYDEHPEALAFSLPVGRTFSQRHHIRIWHARYELVPATPVWLATASYDSGYAIAAGSLLPVHDISPAIDLERDYVVASMARAGVVADTTRIQYVPPEMGTNAFGEPFFTYGQAVVLRLSQHF